MNVCSPEKLCKKMNGVKRNIILKLISSSWKLRQKLFIGAISTDLGLVHYELHDKSINKERYWAFLLQLKKKMKGRKWILYQDNLKVHTSEESIKFFEEQEIENLFSPVYSPEKKRLCSTYHNLNRK